MNVLFNCLASISGGAVAHVRNVAPRLSRRFAETDGEHQLIFLAHEEQRSLLEGVKARDVHWVRGPRPVGYQRVLWEHRHVPTIAEAISADVLFTAYQIGPRVSQGRHVMMLHSMEPFLFRDYRYSPKSWVRNYLLAQGSKRCLKAADRIISVSGFATDYLAQKLEIDRTRIRTIHHGRPDLSSGTAATENVHFLRDLGIKGDFLLTCGSLLPYRRCEDVVAAFGEIASTCSRPMQLVIAGSGTDPRYGKLIRAAIAKSSASGQILPLGHVPWETMKRLYDQCTACVIATEIEACPNIAIEAMAAGCAIIADDRPPLPEMFQGCCEMYPARDVSALVQVLKHTLENDGHRAELRKRALVRSQWFSWDRCADETYAALTQWP